MGCKEGKGGGGENGVQRARIALSLFEAC